MAYDKRVRNIKHAQRESLLRQSISEFIMAIVRDDAELEGLSLLHVKLSPDRSTCRIFVTTPGGKAGFEKMRPQLVLYRPSMRASLAKVLDLRYTPQLRFIYDEQFEKQQQVDDIIEDLKVKGKL